MTADPPPAADVQPKAKVFISYSRQDAAFADRLEVALKQRGFEPLIDRTDIYAFEDWWKRVEVLIAQADTVVFVLSPDALRPGCVALKEVGFAASLNKRFAPIVFRPVEQQSVPETLAKLNFIFFDDETQFDASAVRLAEALNTDISWIRQHTEFGEAARRWAAAGRPGGLLLRSPVLEEAERWIASRPQAAPEPTAETQAFVADSRRGATRRRNILTGSLAAGLAIALMLAGLAYWQRGIAAQQRESALATKSRLLAIQAARFTSEGDIQTSILLSLEALRSPGDVGPDRYDVEIEKALLDALYRNPLRAILRAQDGKKYVDAAFVGGTSVLVTVSADGSVAFWNVDDNGRLSGRSDVPAAFGPVRAVIANPSRPILVFRGKDARYSVWNYETRQTLPSVVGTCSDDSAQFTFNSTGRRLFVYCGDVRIFDLDTGRLSLVSGKFKKFAVTPDGHRFAVSAGRAVTVMDGMTAAIVSKWNANDSAWGLGISYDGKTIFVSHDSYVEFRLTATGKEALPPLTTTQFRTERLLASNTQNIVVTDSVDGRVVWNVDHDPAPVQKMGATNFDGAVDAFLPNGFLASRQGPKITLWEYATEGHSGDFYPINRGDLYVAAGHKYLSSSTNGKKIVTLGSRSGDIFIWSSDPAMLLHSVDDKDGKQLGFPAVFDAQGKLLATVEQPSSDASKITMWDATRLVVTQELSLDKPWPIKLAVSGDGQSLLYINRDGSYDVLDVSTHASVKSANLPPKASAAALNSDGKTLVVAYDKTISIWNLTSGANVRQCDTADPVSNLILTDEEMIVYATNVAAVAVLSRDSCKSENIFSFSIEQDQTTDLYLHSKQGLVVANLAGHLQIWREKDSRKIFDSDLWTSPDARAHRAYLDLLPGDRIVVSGESGSNLHIYDLTTKDQILSFTTDTSEYSLLEALQATSSGDQLITLWGERGDYRLGTWRLFPTIAAASALAKEVVPECLSQSSRKNLGLDPDPPRWCIEMNKRPYDTLQWREWLSNRNAGRASAFPGSN